MYVVPGSIQCLTWCKFFTLSISGSWTRCKFDLRAEHVSIVKAMNMIPHRMTMMPITTKGPTNQYFLSKK